MPLWHDLTSVLRRCFNVFMLFAIKTLCTGKQKMIFLYFFVSLAEIVEQCNPISEGYVLSKYFTQWCPSCQKIVPLLDEISNKIDKHDVDLKIRNVDCDACACTSIKTYPTLEMSKDGKKLGVLEGFQEYERIVDFIVEHTGIDRTVFDGHVARKEATVRQLTRKDFLSGFDGPYVVLFYSRKDDKYRDMFKELAKIYDGRLNVGEISSDDSAELVNRYDIKAYPSVSGIFNGLVVPFLGKDTLPSLIEFCDQLIEPAFQSLTVNGFNDMVSRLEPGEPVYIVLHRNVALASVYFQKLAHMYKFRAKIYKSDDPHLFEKASIFPKELEHGGDGSTTSSNHSDVVVLSVYKNGVFYRYTDTLGDESKVTDWIFHTHYKYLTKIDNHNFYSIFHGLKPVMILLTQSEQFVDRMNEFSADRHLGVPYTDMVFATMETDDYPLFIPTLLPRLKTPALIVFEPWTNLFYHKKIKLTDTDFTSAAMTIYSLYQERKLPLYPPKSSNILGYLLLGALVLGVGFYYTSKVAVGKKHK